MQLAYLPKKHRSVALGLIRTVPFVSAALLSIVLYYRQTSIEFEWERDGIIGLIFLGLSWTVFYAVSQQLPYSKRTVIDDLLQAAVSQLGHTKYRINIMELRNSEHNPYQAYFQLTYGHGYANPSKYKEKITYEIPGASQAYREAKIFFTSFDDLSADIDPDVRGLWSAPILNRRNESVAVLNIDYIGDEALSSEKIVGLKTSVKELAELITYYWELPA